MVSLDINLGGMLGGGFEKGLGGGMSLMIGGQLGMIAQGIQALVDGMRKLVDIVQDVSPALKGSFDILKRSFQLALKPMADAIGMILLPISRFLLRQAIEWQKKTGFERAKTLGGIGGVLGTGFGMGLTGKLAGAAAGLITLKPEDLFKFEKGVPKVFDIMSLVGFTSPIKSIFSILDLIDIQDEEGDSLLATGLAKVVTSVGGFIGGIAQGAQKIFGKDEITQSKPATNVAPWMSTSITTSAGLLEFNKSRERTAAKFGITPGTSTGGGVNW